MADEVGDIRWGTEVPPGIPVNITDREYFQRLKGNAKAKMAVSPPVVGRITRAWSILIAQRVNHADGSFAGVVLGSIRAVDYFTQMFSVLDIGNRGMIELRDEELALIVRYPKPPDMPKLIGSRAAATETRDFLRTHPAAAVYPAMSGLDGIERIISYRQVAG